jgi:tRNA-Thr(GGU) m(6)t(6)A37 methyltransferase TsaA
VSAESLSLTPIGRVCSPFHERVQAPRQPRAASDVAGSVELFKGNHYEDALADLEGWDHIWLITWFDRNQGWRPKVRPPRSDKKRGVFATRAPYRPNPIGISAVKLERVEGLTLHVKGMDLLDGTPVLDIKPYLAWADSIPEASAGWLDGAPGSSTTSSSGAQRPEDPGPSFEVLFTADAEAQLRWLAVEQAVDLAPLIERVLSTGPRPHAYRRIRELGDGRSRLAVQDWRAEFRLEGTTVTVDKIFSGYTRKAGEVPPAHRAFSEHFHR